MTRTRRCARTLWISVACKDEADRIALYNQFVAEGRAVKYHQKAPKETDAAGAE